MRFFIIFIFLAGCVFGRQRNYEHLKKHDVPYVPWLTGPLLSPTPVNMLPGHPAIEPSITVYCTYGEYNSSWSLKSQAKTWSIEPYLDFQFGITNRIGVEIQMSFISNFKQGASSTRMEDSTILLGFQIANDIKDSWIPDIRIDIQETFPTGSYQKLNPKKLGTDSTGQGSFQTGPVLIVQKMLYPGDNFLVVKGSVGYLFPSSVHVEGLNSYGGSKTTAGKVKPGQTLNIFLNTEYSINQRWGCGVDVLVTHQKKAVFSGFLGESVDGRPVTVGLPSSTQVSLAPFVEHSFAPNMGVLWGSWFTIAGRNSSAFASAFFAFLYIF